MPVPAGFLWLQHVVYVGLGPVSGPTYFVILENSGMMENWRKEIFWAILQLNYMPGPAWFRWPQKL